MHERVNDIHVHVYACRYNHLAAAEMYFYRRNMSILFIINLLYELLYCYENWLILVAYCQKQSVRMTELGNIRLHCFEVCKLDFSSHMSSVINHNPTQQRNHN